jgi:hypothetical protein
MGVGRAAIRAIYALLPAEDTRAEDTRAEDTRSKPSGLLPAEDTRAAIRAIYALHRSCV